MNTALKFLKTKNFWVSAFDVSGEKNFTKNNWKGRNILLFGAEGTGISYNVLKKVDFNFKINISKNIESLNVSNSVAVVCHYIKSTFK